MTVRFRRPKTGLDWRKLATGLLPAAPATASYVAALLTPAAPLAIGAAAVGAVVALEKAIRDATEAATPERTIDERAWIWLRVSLAAAVFDLLGSRDLAAALDTAERKDAVRDFLADALALDGTEELDAAILTNPAAARFLAPLRDRLPALARAVAPEHRLPDDRIRFDFDRCLRAASARVYALDTAYYAPLADAVTGPFAEGLRRDLAWTRHEDWIRGLFHREQILSLDETAPIPLSAVYHSLRCFWHEETGPHPDPEAPSGHDRAPRPRVAHIADLHATLHAWLNDAGRDDRIRVVAGGPGSGKSSFSRAFAVEAIDAGDRRVIYIRLQHMPLGADLHPLIGSYLRGRWHATAANGGEGFPENPLDWRAQDTLPTLLVFDGLDELSHDDDTARDLTRKFIRNVHAFLSRLGGPPVHALILGRPAACQDALAEAELDPRCLIHVAPLTPLTEEGKASDVLGRVESVDDPSALGERDERPDFWKRSASSRGVPADPTPEAVTAPALLGLNAEPLLLHLLVVSGYTDENWQAAADNRNRVYEAIFRRIFERNKAKDHPATRNLAEADFFTLLESLGLAAWRGNGRTGSEQDFATLRNLHATGAQRQRFESLEAAQLRNVAVQFHARRDLDAGGFEFIHKSFGEYLAARGLLSAGRRAARRMTDAEEPVSPAQAAEDWTGLIGPAELSEEILRFLIDEARLVETPEALPPLTKLFQWTLAHGMPAHKADPGADWRRLETMQRCAESALLAVLNALLRVERSAPAAEDRPAIACHWPDERAAFDFLNRIAGLLLRPARLALGWLDLRKAQLRGACLVEAYLSGADLGGANLRRADLRKADLRGANLIEADLSLADLSRASLRRADLRRANLSVAVVNWADLSGAFLRRADLRGASLRRADLRGANLIEADLRTAFLFGADLSRADLHGAHLGGANLTLVGLAAASLRFADLRHATVRSPVSVQLAFG
ncbi:pentapeptide repeat-containing protein, partial [Amaricoccus sp.]|uniref:pentapeptide repeat-containing protein n=1 Tax=Amaricoccus sp. TaxID=1872485 RepID=UPI0025BA515D